MFLKQTESFLGSICLKANAHHLIPIWPIHLLFPTEYSPLDWSLYVIHWLTASELKIPRKHLHIKIRSPLFFSEVRLYLTAQQKLNQSRVPYYGNGLYLKDCFLREH